jgi:hypothetical protein
VSTLGAQRSNLAGGTPPSVAFRGGVSATYREFFSSSLSNQRNVSGHGDMRLDILPQHPWGAAVFGTYDRAINPTVFGDPDLSFNRDDVSVGGELIAQPAAGTLDWRVGYQLHAALFESSNGAPFDNITHEASTRGRWKFRPRTAFIYDATARFLGYSQANRATVSLHDSTPVRTRIGITGLITPRFAALGMVGWGSSFHHPGTDPTVQQYDSVIGQAELKFFPGGNPEGGDVSSDTSLTLSSIAVGYVRDFSNSYLGDFYGSDRGYAKIAYFVAGRALVSLEGGVGAIEYPKIFYNPGAGPPVQAHDAFTDVRADATLFAEYRFIDTLGLNATVNYTQNISNTQLPLGAVPGAPGAAAPGALYDMSWQRFQAFLGVRWFM